MNFGAFVAVKVYNAEATVCHCKVFLGLRKKGTFEAYEINWLNKR
jgi:hypothetical protein